MSATDEAATTDERPAEALPPTAPDRGILSIAAVLLVIAGLLIYGNLTMRVNGSGAFGPQTFPWIVAGICILAAALIVIETLRHPRAAPSTPEQDAMSGVSVLHDPFDERVAPQLRAEASEVPKGVNWVKLGTALAALIGFTLILEPVGWLISATVLFWAMSVALGGRRHVPALVMGLGLASVIQVVFGGLLGMSLPAGILLLGS
ncbi:MAG: tripartite tricarboxylate transporter TctB family protein [Micropruina sp.]|uniref:tripartite tricarboxylate transporter TctB family protein n=1 Tax=Micropruina sp. TaxID=2737536 RepID=UPI0039E5191F